MTSGLLAHGIGAVDDLPVPTWLFYYGAALVLIASFVALGVLWKEPLLDKARARSLPQGLQQAALSPFVRVLLGGVSFALLVLVVGAALFGSTSPTLNLAPTFVYVAFWLGLPLLSVLLGNVWRVLDPWRAAADAIALTAGRTGLVWQPPLTYPERLGRWPAPVLLTAFVALELAYTHPEDPRAVGIAALVYCWITWTGAAAFGRRAWFENGDAFTAYFGLFARMAPLAGRGRELFVRLPITGLARRDEAPGTIALIAVVLGSVAFDGLSRTNWWEDRTHTSGTAATIAINLAGLGACVGFAALTYLTAVAVAGRFAGGRHNLRRDFVGSLVPIAFAYLVAHYFSLFVLQGQYLITTVSDPLGRGWDLLGTKDVVPDLTILSPETTWYVQVGALVVGHVLGLVLAHDRALAVFPSVRSALRAQYAMLALMVLYTVGGMWILSRP
ncbi:MAG: fenitrothion hydrolase [Gaiellaceae bacterium]